MNSSYQGKQCPRCRSNLSKTHSQKIICKQCGYTTNKLQVVRQSQAFDGNIRFSRKVTIKKDNPQNDQNKSKNKQKNCVSNFQQILKTVGQRYFGKYYNQNEQKYKNLLKCYKDIWFQYLTKMTKQSNQIYGVLTHFINKNNKDQISTKQLKEIKQIKQLKDQESQSSSDQQQNQQQDQQSKQQIQNIKPKINRKRQKNNSTKDLPLIMFKKVFLQYWKLIKEQFTKNRRAISRIKYSQKFLQKITKIYKQQGISQSSVQSLEYLAQKYVLFLSLQKNSSKIKLKASESSINIRSTYISKQDIRHFSQIRNLPAQKPPLIHLFILCYDLMSLNSPSYTISSFKQLTQSFKLSQSQKLINQVIWLVEMLGQKVKVKEVEKKQVYPQFGLRLICAIIYLTTVFQQETHTMLEIVNGSVEIMEVLIDELKNSIDQDKFQLAKILLLQKNLRVRKVKKVAQQLLNFIQPQISAKPCYTIQKWCLKLSLLLKLPTQYQKQLLLLSSTLLCCFLQKKQSLSLAFNNLHRLSSKRYVILQQPQIVLAIFIIFFKLKFGADKEQYPYFVNINEAYRKAQQMVQKGIVKDQQGILTKIHQLMGKYHENTNKYGFNQLINNISENIKPLNVFNSTKDIGLKDAKQLWKKLTFYSCILENKQKKLQLQNSISCPTAQTALITSIPKLAQSAAVLIAIPQLTVQFSFISSTFQQQSSLNLPSKHYEIIYQPTINTLGLLGMKELCVLLEAFTRWLYGEYNDVREITQYMARMETVLGLFGQ